METHRTGNEWLTARRRVRLRWQRMWLPAAVTIAGLLGGPQAVQGGKSQSAATQPADVPLSQKVEAELRTWQTTVQVGQPVWVEFVLRNLTAEPITLEIPGAESSELLPPAMGLPLAYVFSGPDFRALEIRRDPDVPAGQPVFRRPSGSIPTLVLAPLSSVGVQLNLAKWYPVLRRSGEYRLQWRPFAGQLVSNTLSIKIATLKDAIIETDFGAMRIRLYYNKAPRHVENFLELVQDGFYDGLTFHRILKGFVVQGGCPNGDGTGVRPDGRRLKAEFNDTPFKRGTVGMARAPDDPDSASCQFFIAFSRLSQLDGKFTAFGELVGKESFETLSKIEQVETVPSRFGELSRPVKPVYIRAIRLENVPRPAFQKPSRLGRPPGKEGLAVK